MKLKFQILNLIINISFRDKIQECIKENEISDKIH